MKLRFITILLIGLLILETSGCGFLGSRPEVVIIESDNRVSQIVGDEEVTVRDLDPTTGQVATTKEKLTGKMVISPTMYKKLVNSAVDNKK